MWVPVLIASLGAYLEKILGYVLPQRFLEKESVRRMTGLLPISMLSALVAIQTFSLGNSWSLDARALGLCAAVIALIMRAPFLLVILTAAGVTAVTRFLMA